ncbi:MAG TPA: hypothetical protein PLJ37_00690 [Chitinophagales bacterium]|nr:hypothetical protein [Chitinophagales bacterium]HMW93468.1 hypothetical protein [Chitinophagales bacterium]HMZ92909.1 hypothetical protein [Chitinophagales bacterium]HNG25902.1 hypothetical protein [Chitinophagales bacterium]
MIDKDILKLKMDELRVFCLENDYHFLSVALPKTGGEAIYRTTIKSKDERLSVLNQLVQLETRPRNDPSPNTVRPEEVLE